MITFLIGLAAIVAIAAVGTVVILVLYWLNTEEGGATVAFFTVIAALLYAPFGIYQLGKFIGHAMHWTRS